MPDADFVTPCGVFALFIAAWTCVVVSVFGCLQFVCFPIYVPVCGVYFMFDCVDDLFVDSVCYMYG